MLHHKDSTVVLVQPTPEGGRETLEKLFVIVNLIHVKCTKLIQDYLSTNNTTNITNQRAQIEAELNDRFLKDVEYNKFARTLPSLLHTIATSITTHLRDKIRDSALVHYIAWDYLYTQYDSYQFLHPLQCKITSISIVKKAWKVICFLFYLYIYFLYSFLFFLLFYLSFIRYNQRLKREVLLIQVL